MNIISIFASKNPPLEGEGDRAQRGGGVSAVRLGALSRGGYPSVSPSAIHLPLKGRI